MTTPTPQNTTLILYSPPIIILSISMTTVAQYCVVPLPCTLHYVYHSSIVLNFSQFLICFCLLCYNYNIRSCSFCFYVAALIFIEIISGNGRLRACAMQRRFEFWGVSLFVDTTLSFLSASSPILTATIPRSADHKIIWQLINCI